jgi:hypothetical protein
MSSKYFEPEGTSSERWLYVQVRYSVFYVCTLKLQHNAFIRYLSKIYSQYFVLRYVLRAESSIKVLYCYFSMHNTFCHKCTYSCLSEDEPSGLKHVDVNNLKINILTL